jgi:predicted nucleic acid-binding protein
MIHLDTSVLIDALSGPRPSGPRLRRLIEEGERISLSSIVVFEWRRGPRTTEEIADQEDLFPASDSIPFGAAEALVAAEAYRKVKRPRGREIDIAIAACAIAHGALLWTLNPADFKDIPNLKLLPAERLSMKGNA